ncbi:hypothetical protein Q5W_18290 [Hydrogenophaga sp. PBC]|nr:hypothetical protein Q5W_18290 [Hydrogenophaga sp. PBC]
MPTALRLRSALLSNRLGFACSDEARRFHGKFFWHKSLSMDGETIECLKTPMMESLVFFLEG